MVSELLTWLRDEKREGGPQGFIGFAISARMSAARHMAIEAVAEAEWKPYPQSSGEEIRECAEAPFVPGAKSELKDSQPLRYVAVRVRKRQGELFDDGSAVRLSPRKASRASESSLSRRRPNIILILADDMGFSDIGCYGSEILTPHKEPSSHTYRLL